MPLDGRLLPLVLQCPQEIDVVFVAQFPASEQRQDTNDTVEPETVDEEPPVFVEHRAESHESDGQGNGDGERHPKRTAKEDIDRNEGNYACRIVISDPCMAAAHEHQARTTSAMATIYGRGDKPFHPIRHCSG